MGLKASHKGAIKLTRLCVHQRLTEKGNQEAGCFLHASGSRGQVSDRLSASDHVAEAEIAQSMVRIQARCAVDLQRRPSVDRESAKNSGRVALIYI